MPTLERWFFIFETTKRLLDISQTQSILNLYTKRQPKMEKINTRK